jgi:hypothetical protein
MLNSFVTDRIPQFVAYSDLPHTKNKIVACTQTRRVTTTAIAQRVADEMDGLFVLWLVLISLQAHFIAQSNSANKSVTRYVLKI